MTVKTRIAKLEQTMGRITGPEEAADQDRIRRLFCLLVDALPRRPIPERLYDALIEYGWLSETDRGNAAKVAAIRAEFLQHLKEASVPSGSASRQP